MAFKEKVVRTISEIMMGSKRYSYSERRKKEISKITASRRRLREARARMKKEDEKIGERLKTIDKLHTKLKRSRKAK